MKNRIQQYRKEKRITQEELGERMGVSRQTIISLESGRYNASLQLAMRLARFFDVRVEELFIDEEESI